MYRVIYTKTLDHADDVIAESEVFEDEKSAIAAFNDSVQSHISIMLNNELLNCKMSIHKHKALIKIEGTHYCIAIVKDNM